MRDVFMFSGGIGSWAGATRYVQRKGAADLTLLFCDTLVESAGLYRFVTAAAADIFRNMPPNLVRITEGRTPWQVFHDEGMIGNTKADLCSRILKRDLGDAWLAANCDPADTTVYLGIDWSEAHRFDNRAGGGAKHRYARLGWRAEVPLCDPPYLTKPEMISAARASGLPISEAYADGFPHDNCGGFCIKAGQAHFATLLRARPAVYAENEAEEAAFRERTGKDVSVLRDRRGGVTKPWPLRDFRHHIEAGGQHDLFEWGGCGCFTGSEDA